MSESNASSSAGDGDELQFDQAEYATPVPDGPSCGSCNGPIEDAYFELGGKICCASCRQRVEAALRGGSRVVRAVKALFFGSLAAVVGVVLYFAIAALTGYDFGIVAVVVGFMVGASVRKGTGNRGGVFYQFLAVFLTYSAIGLMDLPFAIHEDLNAAPQGNEQAQGVLPQMDGAAAALPAAHPPERSPLGLVGQFVLLLYGIPVLETFHSPIAGLIYGFALWEAWRLNRRVRLVFNGPFRVSTGDSIAPAPEDIDDGG